MLLDGAKPVRRGGAIRIRKGQDVSACGAESTVTRRIRSRPWFFEDDQFLMGPEYSLTAVGRSIGNEDQLPPIRIDNLFDPLMRM